MENQQDGSTMGDSSSLTLRSINPFKLLYSFQYLTTHNIVILCKHINQIYLHAHCIYIYIFQERTDEYARLSTLGGAFGVQSEKLTPEEVRDRWPLLSGPLRSALFSPADGLVDPAMATAAMLRVARSKGAQVSEECAMNSCLFVNISILVELYPQ